MLLEMSKSNNETKDDEKWAVGALKRNRSRWITFEACIKLVLIMEV